MGAVNRQFSELTELIDATHRVKPVNINDMEPGNLLRANYFY